MNLKQLLNDSRFDVICVPRLQRDYAQGRHTVKIDDIRNTLLSEIFSGMPVHLNMIFGDVDDSLHGCRRFIPIDGQQRLTTLFLLYLYRNKMISKKLGDDTLKKFTYETRRSSTDFIKQLVENGWTEKIETGKFSETIRNENWYRQVWDDDPTVAGMLVMLNDIHKYAMCQPESIGFPDLDKITFDFENLKDLGLNETLYIKMNSRGLELTNFEILKCSMENNLPNGHIDAERECFKAYEYEDNIDGIRDATFADQWKWCMDRKWSDWFWNSETLEGDSYFLKFITAYSIGFDAAYGKDNQSVKIERIGKIRKRLTEHTLSWEQLIKGIESQETRDRYFVKLAKLLNRMILTDGIFKSSWGDTYVLKDISEMKYKPVAVLFAISCYEGNTLCERAFDEWMRVCFNLIEYIDSGESFIAFCSQIKDLTGVSTDILNGLQLTNSSSRRLQQEKIKATLLLRGVRQLRDAESHQLFLGNVRQMLVDCNNQFTGIFNTLKWSNFARYFSNDGNFKPGIKTDFVVAFFKSCNSEDQLNDGSEILNFSPDNTRNRLAIDKYVSVFHNMLTAPSLQEVEVREITDSAEWNQYRDTIAYGEIVDAILAKTRSMQFGMKGMEFLYRKGSWLSSNYYIALDYKKNKLYRNSFLAKIGYEGNRVAENHDLWWVADVNFEIDGHQFEWNVWNWIYLLDSNGDRVKRTDGTEICLNVYSVEEDNLITELRRLISERTTQQSENTGA